MNYQEAKRLSEQWLEGKKEEVFKVILLLDNLQLAHVVLLIAEFLNENERINFRISLELRKHDRKNNYKHRG